MNETHGRMVDIGLDLIAPDLRNRVLSVHELPDHHKDIMVTLRPGWHILKRRDHHIFVPNNRKESVSIMVSAAMHCGCDACHSTLRGSIK